MFCRQCGSAIPDGSAFCASCGAAQGAGGSVAIQKRANGKLIVSLVIAAAAIALILIFVFVSLGAGAGLTGTWEAVYENNGVYYTPYTIEFSSDGNCVIYEYNRVPYSATYTVTDSGTYVTSTLFTSIIFGSWTIKRDGQNLLISGSGLPENTTFCRVK